MSEPLNLHVVPASSGQVTLTWEFPAGREIPREDQNVIIWRTGGTGAWERVPEEDGYLLPEEQTYVYAPRDLRRRLAELRFRAIVQAGGLRYDSPDVGIYHTLSPREFAAVRRMVLNELQDMKDGNGHPVVLAKVLTSGDPADSYDPSTGQILNPTSDLSGFGERFHGGYHQPVLPTWIKSMDTQQQTRNDGEGKGLHDRVRILARTFAFPRALPRDLIIDRASGLRYLVNETKPYFFKGVVPVMMDLQLEQLPFGHIKYKFQPQYAAD